VLLWVVCWNAAGKQVAVVVVVSQEETMGMDLNERKFALVRECYD